MRKLWLLLPLLALLVMPKITNAAFTYAWDETVPTNATYGYLIDDYMRQFNYTIRERLAIDHYFLTTDLTTSDSVGYHKWISFIQTATDKDTDLYGGHLYEKTDGGLYFRTKSGTVIRLTDSTGLDSGNVVTISGTQTITGKKTFSDTTTFDSTIAIHEVATFDSDKLPTLDAYVAPSTDAQLAPKKYVDDSISNNTVQWDYVKVSDTKAVNTDGGTFTSGAWRTRDINTEDSDVSGICSIASDQITLDTGTYECEISCPTGWVKNNKAILYDVTHSDTLLIGTSEWHDAGGGLQTAGTRSFINGKFVLAHQAVLEIRHRCTNSVSNTGFGYAANLGNVEVYTTAVFRRVGE